MTAMKKLFIYLTILAPFLMVSSCTTSRKAGESGEARKQKKLINQELVREAVESRRFIVKLDRIYLFGGMLDLIPRTNYIIVDGEKAIISATYFGRQYDIRPIAGINIRGIAKEYEMISKV